MWSPSGRLRLAAAGMVAALVGCLAPHIPVPGEVVGLDRVEGETAATADRPGGPPAGRVAYVVFRIGGNRRAQLIPADTKTIGIAIRSLSGENLIQSALCGTDSACYSTIVGQALASFTGQTVDVRVEARLTDVPLTPAKVFVYSYATEAYNVTTTSPRTAQGEAGIDLYLGKTATASVKLVATPSSSVDLLDFWPTMGGLGVPVRIRAANLDPAKGSVEFSGMPAVVTFWQAGDPGVVIALAPTGSAEPQIKVVDTSGSATFATRFLHLDAIDLPWKGVGLVTVGSDNDITASATTSTGGALATASVTWSLVAPGEGAATGSAGGAGPTPTPDPSGAPTPTPLPSGAPTPTPDPSATPAGSFLEYSEYGDYGQVRRGLTTGDDYPYHVRFRAQATGSYEIRIQSGLLFASRSITVQ